MYLMICHSRARVGVKKESKLLRLTQEKDLMKYALVIMLKPCCGQMLATVATQLMSVGMYKAIVLARVKFCL
jgi:hypothetical protein